MEKAPPKSFRMTHGLHALCQCLYPECMEGEAVPGISRMVRHDVLPAEWNPLLKFLASIRDENYTPVIHLSTKPVFPRIPTACKKVVAAPRADLGLSALGGDHINTAGSISAVHIVVSICRPSLLGRSAPQIPAS
jgi:hypothetical protein